MTVYRVGYKPAGFHRRNFNVAGIVREEHNGIGFLFALNVVTGGPLYLHEADVVETVEIRSRPETVKGSEK